jgi:hypothetical protein
VSTGINLRTVVQDEGTNVPSNNTVNFTGAGVTVTNIGGAATVVIPGPPASTGLVYQGLWDATANSPALTSGVGTVGHYYIVSTAGTTNLNGVTDWQVGDWAIFVQNSPDEWQKVDNHDVQAYNTVKDESTILPQRSVIKFTGTGVTATDSGGETVVDVPGNIPATNFGLFAQTGNSTPITNGSQGTLIDSGVGTLSVPANGFSIGDSFRADFGGLMSCKNNETLTIRVKAGATVLSLSPSFTLPGIANQVWLLNINFTIRAIGPTNTASIVVLANLHILKLASGTQEGFGWNTINSTTFDTTISNILDVTAQWGSNTPAQNSIYSDIFVLNKIY